MSRRWVASAPVSKIRRSSSSRTNAAHSATLTTKAGPSHRPAGFRAARQNSRADERLPGDDAREEKLARPGREVSRAGPNERQVAGYPAPVRRQEVEAPAEVRQVRERDDGEVDGPEDEEPAPEHPEVESSLTGPASVVRRPFRTSPSSSARLYAGQATPVPASEAAVRAWWTGGLADVAVQ